MPDPHAARLEAGPAPFRPRTRTATAIERMANESGRSAAAILAHIGSCNYRRRLFLVCRRLMFDGSDDIHFGLNAMWLLQDFGEDKPCYECRAPCRLQRQAAAREGIMAKGELFQPTTRLALTIERLAAESGHSVAAILTHVGTDPGRNFMLRLCRSLMFDHWDQLDGDRMAWRVAERGYASRKWSTCSAALLKDIGRADEIA